MEPALDHCRAEDGASSGGASVDDNVAILLPFRVEPVLLRCM